MPSGFSIDIEENSPIFIEEGSQSVSVTVPGTSLNRRIFRFPNRLDTASDPNSPRLKGMVSDGVFRRSGAVNVTGAGRGGISFNIGFDNSAAYVAWSGRKLRDLSGLPELPLGTDRLIGWLGELYASGTPQDDLAVFPVALSVARTDEGTASEKRYWEMVNVAAADGSMVQPGKVVRMIGNEPTQVTVPKGYGLTPFLRVWRVLELIFSDLGVRLVENPFEQSLELARLTVLNNVADTICHGTLRYSELMPDCTVGEFLNALWVRFGLTVLIDSEKGTASLRLIDNILREAPALEIDPYVCDRDTDVGYLEGQYIKLSASTGIEGASPACERFEDYIKDLSLLDLHVGAAISSWTQGASGGWQGEIEGADYPEPEYPDGRDPSDIPDPWDDYDDDFWFDDRDDGRDRVAASTRAGFGSQTNWLGRETVTGRWWKLDSTNRLKKDSSSGFFNWDPADEDLTALELTSCDEFVPVEKISIGTTGTAHRFNGYAPAFLTGSRHFHTYIKGNDTPENDGDTTPLAFMLAYNLGGSTIGRLAPEDIYGQEIKPADGGEAGPTLYFQFADGLFARYWRRYDELLRHGMRSIETRIRIGKGTLQEIDMLRPVIFRGCRCLIERMEYTLPSGTEVAISLKLRTISPLGSYDIEAEQGIPAVSMTAAGLGWVFLSCDWQEAEDELRPELDRTALLRFRTMLQNREGGERGDEMVVDAAGITATGNWIEEIPKTLPAGTPTAPVGTRKVVIFRGRVYYSCRMTRHIYDPETDATISKTPVGDVVAGTFVDYTFEAIYVSAYTVRR